MTPSRATPLPSPGKRFSMVLYDESIPGRIRSLLGRDLRIEGGWDQFGGGGGGGSVDVDRLLYFFAEEGGPWEGYDGAYQEILPSGDPFPTSIIWWTSAAKTHKIIEQAITYNVNLTIDEEITTLYALDGSTVAAVATDTYAYSGVIVTSKTRIISYSITTPPVQQLNYLTEEGGPWEGFTGAYQEFLPLGDPFPTSIIWWTSPAKTAKIVEEQIAYNPNLTVSTDTWILYDTDGSTVLVTAVDVFAYSGVIATSRTRTIT